MSFSRHVKDFTPAIQNRTTLRRLLSRITSRLVNCFKGDASACSLAMVRLTT